MTAPAVSAGRSGPQLAEALDYAGRGWRVVDLEPGEKHPTRKAWPQLATVDAVTLAGWWREGPARGVAIVTGSASGLVVLDVDPRNGGEQALAALLERNGALPVTPEVLTGGGGRHFYFAHPGGAVRTWHPAEGLDLLGDGGRCVAAPPTVHPSGTAYQWAPDRSPAQVPLAPLPAWLVKPEPPPRPPRIARPAVLAPERGRRWAEAALERECARVAQAAQGTRNHELNGAAFALGQIVGGGHLDREAVAEALEAAADSCGLVAEDGRGTVMATIRSGLDAGEKQPRGPEEREPVRLSVVRGEREAEAPRYFKVRDDVALADEALAALAAADDAGVYVRARRLVRVVRSSSNRPRTLHRPEGAPVIEMLSADALRDRLARMGSWVRVRDDRNPKVALPPDWLTANLLARGSWPLPELEGVLEAPTLRPDGSVLDRAGFDTETGLLLEPDGNFPPVPERPAAEQTRDAIKVLCDPLRDFPFREETDRAAAVAAMLSLVARHAILGPVPLFAVRATAPASGKSLLADVFSIVGTGRVAARMTPDSDDTETRKRILAVALEGCPVVLLDNVDFRLGSKSLAAALTASTWQDRLLGSTATVTAPLRAVWLATGNGLTFRGDLGRRVVPIDLDAKHEHPEDRPESSFHHPRLLEHVRAIRPALVCAALTVLRAYRVAGMPPHGKPRKGSFEAWDELVRGACVWAAIGDPDAGKERVRLEDDSDLTALRAALESLGEVFGVEAFTLAEAVKRAESEPELQAALLDLVGHDRLDSRRLGYRLRELRGRIAGGRCFQVAGARHGAATWYVTGAE